MPASRRGSSTSLRGAACSSKLNGRWRKRPSNPLSPSGPAWVASRNPVIGRAFARPVGSQRRGWGPSANTILRHCEELLRRSNPLFLCAAAWIASRSLSSGAHSRDPLARNDGDGAHLPTQYSVIATSSCDEAIHTFFLRRHAYAG